MKWLKPSIKNYDWGLPAPQSLVTQFAHNLINPTLMYAEAWLGSHPSGPALTDDNNSLTNIPYILKIISVGKPLSLQLHPDKSNATKLHKQFPLQFPDSNDKPEMIVAISDFTALCGLRPRHEIAENTKTLPIKTFSDLFALRNNQELIQNIARNNATVASLAKHYPNDPAVLAPLFMNIVKLKPGEALVVPPNEPHCYLSGQGIECMATSDNVIRAGLTNKNCNLNIFLSLVNCSHHKPITLPSQRIYSHPCIQKHFLLHHFFSTQKITKTGILIVTNGCAHINTNTIAKGNSILIESTDIGSLIQGNNFQAFFISNSENKVVSVDQ